MSDMTQEEKMQFATEAANAEKQSYLFMKRHIHDFTPCQANSDFLTRYIVDNHLEWTQDNLESAFEATKHQLVASNVPKLAPLTEQAPAADQLPPAPAGAAWPTTKAEINSMSQTDYRREYHNTKTGAAFRARITAVLQRGV